MSKARYDVVTRDNASYVVYDNLYGEVARENHYSIKSFDSEEAAAAKAAELNEAYDEMETCTNCYAEVRAVNKRFHEDWHYELTRTDDDRWND